MNPDPPIKACEECGEPIPTARLLAVPNASMCVPCKTASGDEPRIKKFDDHNDQGELVAETFFTKNIYLETQIKRVMACTFENSGSSDEYIAGKGKSKYYKE